MDAGRRLWDPGAAFSSSGADVTADLVTDLCDLNMSGCQPQPRKIRRRNALTIMDGRPPLYIKNPLETFESSSLLQSLEDSTATVLSDPEKTPAGPASYRQATPPKRKIPKAKLKSSKSKTTFKQRSRLKEDISQIRLHQDLTDHMARSEILPESVFESCREQYCGQDGGGGGAGGFCSALVPYQRPLLLSHLASSATKPGTNFDDADESDTMDVA